MTLINQNLIHEEIKCRSNSRDACYHSIQNLSSSSLLSKKTKAKALRTITLPFVLHGCETWSLTLMEEHKTGLFENRILSGPKRDEVTGEWRRLHKEELYEEEEITGNRGKLRNDAFLYFYSSPNITGDVKERKCIEGFAGGIWMEEPHGRRRHRWENISTDRKEIWWGLVGLIQLRRGTNGGLLLA